MIPRLRSSSALRATLLALALHGASGCSWAFMQRAPEAVAAPNYPIDCTSSRAAPVLDSICAGYFVVNGLYLAGQKSCADASFGETCVESGTKGTGVLLSAGLATLCAMSAVSGYGYVTRCEAVKANNAQCITGDEAACKRLNSTWTPPMTLPAAPMAAPGPSPAPIPVPAGAGCTKDVDCKGSRVCERGVCVEPAAKAGP